MKSLSSIIKNSRKTVFFGGAGVSTESGIPDFRSSDGIYSKKYGQLSPEAIISASFFRRDPETFFEFYRSHLIYPNAKPNAAHTSLSRLEKSGHISAVITQNIDGLHTAAGSRCVYELHGSTQRNYCIVCGKHYDLDFILSTSGVPRCSECGSIVRPDVTLYEENLPSGVFEAAVSEVESSDVLIVGGTSLAVYPAASLLYYFHGSELVIINYTETPYENKASLVIHDSIGKALSSAADEILSDGDIQKS